MDPLSITASAIAIIQTVVAAATVVKLAHQAPGEIRSLVNAVADLEPILQTIHDVIKLRATEEGTLFGDRQPIFRGLEILILRASNKVEDANKVLQTYFVLGSNSRDLRRLARITWLKDKPRLNKMMDELVNVKIDIIALWTASNSVDLSQVSSQLRSLSLSNCEGSRSNSASSTDVDGDTLVEAENITSRRTSATSVDIEACESGDVLSETSTLLGDSKDNVSLPVVEKQIIPKRDLYQVMRSTSDTCVPWCSCVCHRRRFFASPSVFDWMIGAVILAFTGQVVSTTMCTERTCKRQNDASVRFRYQFPGWLAAKAISVAIKHLYTPSPELIIRMTNTCPGDSELFLFATTGNVEGIKELFAKGLASPHDVEYSTGVSALHKAIDWRQTEAAKLLCAAGSDPFMEDQNGWTAADVACQVAFSKDTKQSGDFEAMVRTFQRDIWETQGFSVLHKIILGLADADLEKQLLMSTADIDSPDACGQTPLFWAALRGESNHVDTLLRFGADPNKRSVLGETALHWSIDCENDKCTRSLIHYGVDVNAKSVFGTSALHYAIWTHDDPNLHIESIISAGADLNAKNLQGRVPLHYATHRDSVGPIAYLVEAGANIDVADNTGYTPLMEALRLDLTSVARYYLQMGANYSSQTGRGQTALHLLAQYANEATMHIFETAGCHGLDVNAKDCSERTPRDILTERSNVTSELRAAFKKVESSMDFIKVMEVVVDEVEIFEDAVEFI